MRQAPVAGLVDDYVGVSAYMEIGALHRLMREGDSLSGAYLQVDAARAATRSTASSRRRPRSPA